MIRLLRCFLSVRRVGWGRTRVWPRPLSGIPRVAPQKGIEVLPDDYGPIRETHVLANGQKGDVERYLSSSIPDAKATVRFSCFFDPTVGESSRILRDRSTGR